MTFANIIVALGYLTTLWAEARKVSDMITTAVKEGRDITDEELANTKKGAVSAREKLEKTLDK